MPTPIIVVTQPGRAPLHLMVADPIQIGRECDGLLLTDPEISRAHLEIWSDAGVVKLVDLDSSNGTFIAGTRVETRRQRRRVARLVDR